MEYKKIIYLPLLLKILIVGVVTGQKNVINLNNGAYSNLLIAIDRNVPENLTIIENLKTMFTSASQRLYNATKQQVHWSHIKILVPNTWSTQSQYQSASTENSQSANIIVHSFTDDEPYVDNFEGCGKEGSRMHMTSTYILDALYREAKFGNTDNVLVRTWGYYRWGLFKEHYDGDEGTAPTFDITGGGTEGTRCSLRIEGGMKMSDGNDCTMPGAPNTGYKPECRFVPEAGGQTATASLLFGTRDDHIYSLREFCDDDTSDQDSLHNPRPHNLMNNLCNGRSAWSVMTNFTTDFQAGIQPVSNTTPEFEVLQLSSVRSVVLVLDISGSMTTMFTSASQRLYLATKQQLYWSHIKILVPNTWSTQGQYQLARTENSQSANILVHSFTDDEPFVDNVKGCGKEGTLMHMTPAYILDTQYREDKFGNTDSVLVRTWGYYRWGLFKEHYDGSGGGAPAYDSPGGGTEGTRCSLKIKGNVVMPDGTPCQSYPNIGYNPDCRFDPETGGQTATASLLFATRDAHINSIEEFCDDGNSDSDSLHNPLAPNLMNKECNGDSAWRVMTERTTDFQAGVQPVPDTTPVFEVLQLSSVRSVVLVLDISGSMGGNRFDRMIQSSADYIMNVIPSCSKLGIVVFKSTSLIRAHLTDITDTASRQTLVDALPPSAGGGTCIGCGILSGIQVLGSYAQGGYILLLSDGGETSSPYIRDTYDEIENSGVIIDTITISNSADQKMEDLSTNTSGISSFCSDTGTGTCLIQAFHRTITERPDVGIKTVPIQIYSSIVIIEPDPGFYIIPVVIDAALGNETVITVIWTKNSLTSVVVAGPDGTRVDQNDPRYQIDTTNRIVTINLPLAQAGLWSVTINDLEEGAVEYASVSVTSKPTTQEYSPVTVTVLLGSNEVDFAQTPALAIYAQVQQDYLPILDADVTAIISDSSNTTSITLLDNGSGSDLLKDDGVYSGFFLSFTSNGRYNVKVNVVGYDVAENRRGKRSAEVDTAVEPSFMRTSSGGVFKVQGYTPNSADILPPSRIQDLVYTSFSYDNSTVTLSWTTVGDDLDQGTAYNYELRYSTNYYEVRNNFSTSHEVTQDQLVYGNLLYISPAGIIETVTISLPERGQDIVYYFAIRAWDEAGNGGDLSNIASLSIRYIPVSVPTIEPTGPDNLALIIIGACCAVGVVFIVGAVMIYICFRKTHITRTNPESASTQEGLPDVDIC